MTFQVKVLATLLLLQPWLSAANGNACAGTCADETSLLQVKKEIQPGVKRPEAEQLYQTKSPVRIEPPQAVFELPAIPIENGGPPVGPGPDVVPVGKVVEGGAPTGAALNAAGYPIAAGYPLGVAGVAGGYGMAGVAGVAPVGGVAGVAPMGGVAGVAGGYGVAGVAGVAPMGGYVGGYGYGGYGPGYAPVRAAAAQAAQVGAENVVAQSASTITQAAGVAENAAVAAQAYRHYPGTYYGGYGGYGAYGAYGGYGGYPLGGLVAPCAIQAALPYQAVAPVFGGYPQTLYPTTSQSIYSAYPSYPYQQGVYGPAWASQTFFTR